jgi:hypothetical protein
LGAGSESSKASDAGRLVEGAGEANRGERRRGEGSGAGERERDRLEVGGSGPTGVVVSGTCRRVVCPAFSASWDVFGVGGSKLTAGICEDEGTAGGGMSVEGGAGSSRLTGIAVSGTSSQTGVTSFTGSRTSGLSAPTGTGSIPEATFDSGFSSVAGASCGRGDVGLDSASTSITEGGPAVDGPATSKIHKIQYPAY